MNRPVLIQFACLLTLALYAVLSAHPAVGQLQLPLIKTIADAPGVNFNMSSMKADRQGRFWIASDDGIVRYDGKQFRVYHDPLIKKGDDYYSAIPAPDGKIWLRSSLGKYLSYVDPEQDRIIRISDTTRLIRDFVRPFGIRALFIDKVGSLWIGLWQRGMIRVNPQTLAVDHLFDEPVQVTRIMEAPDGTFWIGTFQGLYALNPITRKTTAYRHDPRNPNSLGSDLVFDLNRRPNGQLMVGLNYGIDFLDPVTGQCRRTRLHRHHTPNAVSHVLFAPGNSGEVYVDGSHSAFRYSERDGLQVVQFETPVVKMGKLYVDLQNRLWLLSDKKIRLYDLNRIRPIPAIHVLDVKVNGARLEKSTPNHAFTRDSTGKLSLTMNEDESVEIHFATTPDSGIARSRFQLVNQDEDWRVNTLTTAKTATYHPKPGSYQFLVSRSRDDSTWEPTVRVMDIEVKSLFYRTWWFRLLVVLFLVGAGSFSVRMYLRRRAAQRELLIEKLEAANLRKLDEFKSGLFANITHEFRTPLTLILNAAEQLTDESNNGSATSGRAVPGWHRERLNTIKRNAKQLTRLIVEMLDISRLDAHKMEVHRKVGDPVALVRETVQSFDQLASQRGIDLHFGTNRPATLPELSYLFDDDKLGKITYNLLSNAVKFTPKGGEIGVDCTLAEGPCLSLIVRDTGVGIAADQLPRIFERFYQRSDGSADSATTRQFEGTGIGLAYVKELTELMGGQVAVASKPGEGSTFTVTFPIEPTSLARSAEPYAVADVPLPYPIPASTQKITGSQAIVLVVEDNDELRTYMAEQLQHQYQVLQATNGQEGIEQALQHIPDLIVTDIMMPGVDGYGLVDRLKQDERTSHIPIVVLTAKASTDSRLTGLNAGADDYLTKPFEYAELYARIRNILTARQRWQQHFAAAQHAPDATDVEPVLVLPEKEKLFLERLQQAILSRLPDETIDVNWLVEQSHMSRAQLHRKLIALTNQSTTDFIHSVRLEKARKLLLNNNLTVSEVAFQVGYNTASYFSKVFSEHFGYAPKTLKV